MTLDKLKVKAQKLGYVLTLAPTEIEVKLSDLVLEDKAIDYLTDRLADECMNLGLDIEEYYIDYVAVRRLNSENNND